MKKKICMIVCLILIFSMNTQVQVAFAHERNAVLSNARCYFDYENNVSHTFAVVDITELSIRELQQAVDDGFLTYEQIMRLYLERIEAYGEMYQCITQISETALEEAIACDQIYKEQGRSSLLFGLPAIVKDNLDVAGMATTDGNAFLETKLATMDADVIASLKNAGAIIVAKANMDRYAEHSQYSISDYGRVNNAFDLSMSAYGSSGGSAVSAAASLAPICIGTDTNASIRVPSGANGVVGIRPTYGLLSRKGLTVCIAGRDTAGPIAKTVEDAAIILTALNNHEIDYTSYLDMYALDGMRIGIIERLWNFATPSVKEQLEIAVAVLEDQGAEIVYMPISICDDWENGVGWYGQYFNNMMDQYDVDVAIHPTLWDEVKTHEVAYGSQSSCGSFVAPSAGVPSVTVPMGQNEKGIPYSMEFVARANDDATAIMAAYCFEQARGLHLKTPLAPNLYEIPDNIVALYKLADQEIYPPIDQYDQGESEEYEQVMRAYQAVLDFLDSSYYDDEQANSVANELRMDYYDAVTDYRFSYLRESRRNIKSQLQEFSVDNFVKEFIEHLATL